MGTPDLEVALQTLTEEFSAAALPFGIGFNDLIVDAGGYIGTAAIALARMFPGGTIVSLEPEPRNLRCLWKIHHHSRTYSPRILH